MSEAPNRIVAGTVIVECPRRISVEEAQRLRTDVERAFPGRPVIVLDDGLKLHIAQDGRLASIEAKLDMLISALAEDEQDGAPGVDLEGHPLPAPRNPDDVL